MQHIYCFLLKGHHLFTNLTGRFFFVGFDTLYSSSFLATAQYVCAVREDEELIGADDTLTSHAEPGQEEESDEDDDSSDIPYGQESK